MNRSAACAHCHRAFVWVDTTARLCNRCFLKGVDPELALIEEAQWLAMKAAMAAVRPGLHVRVFDGPESKKKWKALGRELKRDGLVFQGEVDGWMVWVPPATVKKPSKAKCYVCAPKKCRHAHPIHNTLSSMSKHMSDEEARKVVVPGHRMVKASDPSFLSDAERSFRSVDEARGLYIEAMGGCEGCASDKWCTAHPGAFDGRDEQGNWIGREAVAA